MHLVYPRKVCITIVFNFCLVLQSSQEKSKTIFMQNFFGGVNKVHFGLCENGELRLGNLVPRAFVLSCPAEQAKDSSESRLKEDLFHTHTWLNANKLTLNVTKKRIYGDMERCMVSTKTIFYVRG